MRMRHSLLQLVCKAQFLPASINDSSHFVSTFRTISCRTCSALHTHQTQSQTTRQSQVRHKSSNTNLHLARVPVMADLSPATAASQSAGCMPGEIYQMSIGHQEGWILVGEYKVFAWSVSGVESCIVIRSEDMGLVFDMGVSVAESVRIPNVFITHGHVDHIGAVASHVAKRGLYGMKPARYFVPQFLVQPLQTVMKASYEMAQTVDALENVNIVAAEPGEVIRINSRFFVKAFPTIHRVPSQGYIVYKEERKLKEEFKGMEGFEVAALHRQGTDIHDVIITPEIAYTGDTVFDVFSNPPNPDLLKVKLLITEATFLDDDMGKNMIAKARERGHTHLVEITDNAHLFSQVGHIILVHFSNKYSARYISDCIGSKLPPELKGRVTAATVAKATTPSS